ncbi:hypothetical protein CJU90_0661 [Yarrowia sp. C11]|nr:hypothetical protein CKK34_2073 [Yarrowia sp. E02]KAG5372997.1 hypothetical protein CJU90_0661 [Yarrowia sp. C11]
MGRGIDRKDYPIDWILEHYCERYLSRPDEKSLQRIRPLIKQHLRSIGGLQKAGVHVLRFCLITRNLLSPDRSTRFPDYITDVDAILEGLGRNLSHWLEIAPHLAASDPDKIRATVKAETRSIMVLVARECFFVTVDRDGFSLDDLQFLKNQYKDHQKWYDEEDSQQFGMYIDFLDESSQKNPLQLVKTANIISYTLLESAQLDRPVWRRLSEFTDYLTGHIKTIRESSRVTKKHEDEGFTQAMSGLQVASRLAVLREQRRQFRGDGRF